LDRLDAVVLPAEAKEREQRRERALAVRDESGLSAKSAWLPPTQGLRDWKTQMSARDVVLFEALAGDLLATLGYERVSESFSPEIREVADRCRVWWDSEMAKRGAKRKKQETLAIS